MIGAGGIGRWTCSEPRPFQKGDDNPYYMASRLMDQEKKPVRNLSTLSQHPDFLTQKLAQIESTGRSCELNITLSSTQ